MAQYRGRVRTAEDLGRMLQQSRKLSGRTQHDVARELGISQRYVWDLEAGKPSLAMDRLFAMMQANGMQLYAEFADDDNDEERANG